MKLLANVLGGIIHIVAMFYLYSHFLKQYRIKKEFVLAVYVVTGIYGVVYPMFCTMPWQRILCSVVYFSAPLFVYREKFHIKLVMFTAFYVVLGFSELLVKSILLGYHVDYSCVFGRVVLLSARTCVFGKSPIGIQCLLLYYIYFAIAEFVRGIHHFPYCADRGVESQIGL